MWSGESSEWEDRNRQVVLEGRKILERTGESIVRSNQIAIETEAIGTEVISELNDQRETLLRAKNRLTNADDELSRTRIVLRKMQRNVLYNKIILICIILLEVTILVTVCYMKFK